MDICAATAVVAAGYHGAAAAHAALQTTHVRVRDWGVVFRGREG